MSDIQRKTDLICEALVREIGHAKRWSAVEEAWNALLHTRLLSKALVNEFHGPKDDCDSSEPKQPKQS